MDNSAEINYEIYFNLVKNINDYLPENNQIIVISGSGPESKIAADIYKYIKKANPGKHIQSINVLQGEDAKSLKIVNIIWSLFCKRSIDRHSLVVAVGGGSLIDCVGYACANYMRGTPCFYVPTTLLSMVDASIGGKNAINFNNSKNLIGTFYNPSGVLMDVECLKTLGVKEYQTGLYELAKTALLSGGTYYNFVISHTKELALFDIEHKELILNAIKYSADYKYQICQQDFNDTAGTRARLNYGHTLGHALESVYSYLNLSHGEAVGCGMQFAAYLAYRFKLCDRQFVDKQNVLLNSLSIMDNINYIFSKIRKEDVDKLVYFMCKDKKSNGEKLNFVILKDLGKVETLEIPREDIHDILLKYLKMA